MLTTKRYEYTEIHKIQSHPDISNHRALNLQKVSHYEEDILKNGLLEPLVVWEKKPHEFYLIGGFHRLAAINGIRKKNPGYFDRVDIRVVSGEFDEIKALNLKLNADRVDTKITDFFDIVIYLNNANWSTERISEFIDRSVSWIEDIIRYAPGMDHRLRKLLEDGKLSWARAKSICRAVLNAPAGNERKILETELKALSAGGSKPQPIKKPLTFRTAKKNIARKMETKKAQSYKIDNETLLSLILVLEGKSFNEDHLELVKNAFPGLIDELVS
ncbi:MAG: ParB N-terminal domain-containing protein [SAR324 cluster bacterium]|nr:ParB N-terminal domain-containing protein [SAR324 cluster bacterium]